jgi:hypothetical protein
MGLRRESRAVSLALHCYPKHWKARHGDEAAELAQRLTSDGVPAASIAFSYLGGAVRERLAPLVSRRWQARTAALVAAVSVAAASLTMSTSPAPAGALGVVRVEITDRADAVSELTSAFRSHHFPISVRSVPVPTSQVGSIVAAWVTGAPAPSRHIMGEVTGPCADGSKGCIVGLVVPASFTGQATVIVGRRTCAPTAAAKILAPGTVNSNTEELHGQPC